jgi:hypothetical protein
MADADSKPTKRKVTNLDQGPRFVHALGVMTVIPRGAAITATFTAAEVEEMTDAQCSDSEAPRFDVSTAEGDTPPGPTEAEGKPLASQPLAALRKMAADENFELTGRKDPTTQADLPDLKSAADIAAAIEAKRAAQ